MLFYIIWSHFLEVVTWSNQVFLQTDNPRVLLINGSKVEIMKWLINHELITISYSLFLQGALYKSVMLPKNKSISNKKNK